ncbi:Regulation of nuclear pre-mrna domain-containing protein 1b [Thalictrum thalictroides]|uniref:Regulation of nuclear pre-mrna domain-containing protein 1b n=1 Tax=Thalictrum thalictroides TaxID=46969 RepID=A0A7J6WT04_THATH|nr:Regulation of nuclear pre-mrna domain-containing protein 1b [Thalictrum thalictroides]
MTNTFSGHILAEKLSKLNNSQQSIESLSQWCISHRKKAKQVVETWDKLFNSSQRERRVSFLYLANDILQNSRRKGSEFVNEFWKYLPAALKDVFQNSDDTGKKSVLRLVDIWDERKVFGSRGRSLKDEILGKDAPPLLENNGKSLNPIKIVKKDANSIRIKLAVGGTPEKIVSALHSVHDELLKEDTALNKCDVAVCRMEKMEKDVENASTHEQGSRNWEKDKIDGSPSQNSKRIAKREDRRRAIAEGECTMGGSINLDDLYGDEEGIEVFYYDYSDVEDQEMEEELNPFSHMQALSRIGNQQVLALKDELEEQENILRHCIEQLESVKAARTSLIYQLKELLQDQESKLGHVHTQLQVRTMTCSLYVL